MKLYALLGLRIKPRKNIFRVRVPEVSQQFSDLNGEATVYKATRFKGLLHHLFQEYEKFPFW